jgi:hypothetical protein
MSNLNNTISSIGGLAGKCLGNTYLPRPIKSVPVVAVLPVVLVSSLAVYAARSLVSRLFD